ncbi:hypothetical protein BCR39DRAFT_349847 [Naematelia encephala]|uniref:Uncharacterized protein n=1 Tax=Naematelia encephala TaxID=71784 RepID=A0A1Y2ANB6_9TREE|nr:hypothetical protein BCR39DRAFT_349847 [Naematelia encephala]
MPYISPEVLVGSALLVVLAVGFRYLNPPSSSTASKKKKNKKKTKGGATDEVVQSEEEVRSEKKGKRRTTGKPPAPNVSEKNMPEIIVREKATGTSDVKGVAGEAERPSKPKTLAEKIAPKPRKTKVDDMLAPEDRPATHARVLKVVSSATPSTTSSPTTAPAPALAPPVDQTPINDVADYASSNDAMSETGTGTGTVEDDGWDVVPIRKKNPISIGLSSSSSTAGHSSTAHTAAATKIQRKNAKKAEAKKAARAAEEADRQKRLAMHKKDLERERINEIYAAKKGPAKGPVTGTAKASVDSSGKLIWD